MSDRGCHYPSLAEELLAAVIYTIGVADKSFAIYLQHRPRRVAFLVDLEQATAGEILRGILRFNLDSWGGRHNPIVPLLDGAVPESFYPLLDVADPDVFYIYGKLKSGVLEAIHWRYSPTFVEQHIAREPIDSHSYWVGLREQANIRKYLSNLRSKLAVHFRRQEPCVLQLEIPEARNLSPFFLWNFGHTDSNFFAIQNDGIPGCRPKSISDHDLLEVFGNQMNLAWPIHVCGDAPLARTAGDSWRHYFPIFFGDNPWNLIAYWNDGLITGPTGPVRGGMTQLWLTRGQIDDEATYKQLISVLQRRIHSANHQRAMRMVSYDVDETELDRVGKKIAQDIRGTLYYEKSIKLNSPHVGAVVEPRRVSSLFIATRGQIEYATGKEVHVTLKQPPDIEENTDQCWMVDVRIDDPDHELWFSNAEPWWRLPRKPSVAGLFHRSRPQRVIFDNRISFEVGAREATLDLQVPSGRNLFLHLLSPRIYYHLSADLRAKLAVSTLYDIRLSDKGRYLSGILGLSNALRDTLYLFEHPFWRSLLMKLTRREPSEHLTKKLAADVQRLLKTASSADLSTTESWLTHELIFMSKQLTRDSAWLPFSRIQELYEDYVKGLSDDEKQLSRRHDLKSDLSDLTRDNVMFQGAELRCPNCIAAYWYSIEEMRKTVSCRGCHVAFSLPAETQWSYQLNELIRAGVGDQGLLPVLRTLARLFDRAHDCFFFTPSVDFVAYTAEGEPRVEREIDLAWVKDGLFGIAEVKTTTKLFRQGDFENIVVLAKTTRPDVLLIAAPEGNDEDLVKGKKAIEEKLDSKCEVWTWGPQAFQESPFWL